MQRIAIINYQFLVRPDSTLNSLAGFDKIIADGFKKAGLQLKVVSKDKGARNKTLLIQRIPALLGTGAEERSKDLALEKAVKETVFELSKRNQALETKMNEFNYQSRAKLINSPQSKLAGCVKERMLNDLASKRYQEIMSEMTPKQIKQK